MNNCNKNTKHNLAKCQKYNQYLRKLFKGKYSLKSPFLLFEDVPNEQEVKPIIDQCD